MIRFNNNFDLEAEKFCGRVCDSIELEKILLDFLYHVKNNGEIKDGKIYPKNYYRGENEI